MPQVSNFPDDAWQVSPTKYVDDPNVTACTHCHIKFSIVVRRHACTTCPKPFCGKCSLGRVYQENGKYVRRRRCVICVPLTADEEAARAALGYEDLEEVCEEVSRTRSMSAALQKQSPLRSSRRISTGSIEKRRSTKSLGNDISVATGSPSRSPPPFTIHDDGGITIDVEIKTETMKCKSNSGSTRIAAVGALIRKESNPRSFSNCFILVGVFIAAVICAIMVGLVSHSHKWSDFKNPQVETAIIPMTLSTPAAAFSHFEPVAAIDAVGILDAPHDSSARSASHVIVRENHPNRRLGRIKQWLQQVLRGAQNAVRTKFRLGVKNVPLSPL